MSARLRPPRTMEGRRKALEAGQQPPPRPWPDGIRLSIGTLTALPITPPGTVQPPAPGIAMAVAPFTGLIPGLAAWAVAVVCSLLGLSSLVAAAAVLGVLALSTRGLHLDGLADTADGLAASYRRERALEVMRSGDTGPAGVATVLLVLLVQAALFTQVLPGSADVAHTLKLSAVVVLVAVAARVTIPLACRRGVPPARPEGLGATVAGSVSPVALAASAVLAAAICAALAFAAGHDWYAGPLAVLLALIAGAGLLWRATQRFGGITGDVIGACVEAGTVAALIGVAVTL